jgi:hypothetical protein
MICRDAALSASLHLSGENLLVPEVFLDVIRISRLECWRMKTAIVILTVAMLFTTASAQMQKPLNHDPKAVKFITSDIDNFWRAYDLAGKTVDQAKKVGIFQSEYFDKGSDGLKDFTRLRIGSSEKLVTQIEKMPKFYATARRPTLEVAKMQSRLRHNFARFKKLYPDAVFPDVYFLIGVASSGGTTGPSGLLIGAEMYSKSDATAMDELPAWLRSVLAPVKEVPGIVAHESCHYNQHLQGEKNLLAKAIQEGSCDFIGELVSGGNINNHLKAYADPRAAALWKEFTSQMTTADISNWVYNGSKSTDRPGDLGYYIGYKISEAYYQRAKDKRQAVRDILNINGFDAFLKASGYRPTS